jgi:hypothetical protein
MFTLLARITGAGLWGDRGVLVATDSIDEGLKGPAPAIRSNPCALNAAAVIAAQYILLAGEVLVKYANSPDNHIYREAWPTQEKWKIWAAKFKDIARSAPDEDEWDLKRTAQKAYEKMISLWPELFERNS